VVKNGATTANSRTFFQRPPRNAIQSLYLNLRDYPTAAALSFILMAVIMLVVVIYIRFAGSEALMGEEEEAT
jgi:ABC-type spermidine/putrescine transport system permease subunit I